MDMHPLVSNALSKARASPIVSSVMQKANSVLSGGRVLGIDIGSSAAKLVQLSRDERGAVLETYGSIELAPYVERPVGECVQLTPAQYATAIIDLMIAVSAKARRGVIGIPLGSAFTAIIDSPHRTPEQMRHILPTEAQRYIPVSMESVALDWQVLEEQGEQRPFEQAESGASITPHMQKVLLVAVRKETLAAISQEAKAANLSLRSEVDMFSVARTLRRSGTLSESTLVIDLGAAGNTAYVLNAQGQPMLTHFIRDGGTSLTARIAESLHIPFADAETLKRSSDILDSQARLLVEAHYARIFEEASRTAQEYEKQHGHTAGQTVLAGGGALVQGLLSFASRQLGREAKLAASFSSIQRPVILADTLDAISPLYTSAVGLALSQF